jgi:hypothetical protein
MSVLRARDQDAVGRPDPRAEIENRLRQGGAVHIEIGIEMRQAPETLV